MGYEIAVTPLQLVTAYAAIANGGELLEPHIVKEVRSVDGKVVYRARPKAIRRVMSGEVARTIQQLLLAVVQEGTATRADMLTFEVAGKSGTARRTSENAGYTAGNYTASFVGLFPGNDPQYVVLVKLDSPKGAHYAGGEIAAPVTQIVLRAALAASDAALDREGLAASEKPTTAATGDRPDAKSDSPVESKIVRRDRGDATAPLDRNAYDPSDNLASRTPKEETRSFVVDLPASPRPAAARAIVGASRPVPDVTRLSVRQAVRALHGAGFRVRIVTAPSSGTRPAAGTMALPVSMVQLSRPLE
jgi:cell division protein FtsI (penicillin-binding protein 3)